MQRITITLDDALLADVDAFMMARGYASRSEAIRDLARAGLGSAAETQPDPADDARPCIGALVYLFDHETRELARRLTNAHHHHHDLALVTTHVHLDAARCLEVTLLRGPRGAVRTFADHVIAERGVRYGRLVLLPADEIPFLPSAPLSHAHSGTEPAP